MERKRTKWSGQCSGVEAVGCAIVEHAEISTRRETLWCVFSVSCVCAFHRLSADQYRFDIVQLMPAKSIKWQLDEWGYVPAWKLVFPKIWPAVLSIILLVLFDTNQISNFHLALFHQFHSNWMWHRGEICFYCCWSSTNPKWIERQTQIEGKIAMISPVCVCRQCEIHPLFSEHEGRITIKNYTEINYIYYRLRVGCFICTPADALLDIDAFKPESFLYVIEEWKEFCVQTNLAR